MKLEDHSWQVSNLELSKRLKELKVKQESLWLWEEIFVLKGNEEKVLELRLVREKMYHGESGVRYYSAFTCAESGEGLPTYLEKGDYNLTIQKTDVGYLVSYQDGYGACYQEESFCDLSLANAMAKMRVYLLKNKLIKVK